MNSEYLNNKEGSDFEVEQLEALLSEFRIKAIPPSMSRLEHSERRSLLNRYKMALALGLSSLAVSIVAAGSLLSLQPGSKGPAYADLNIPVVEQNGIANVSVMNSEPQIERSKVVSASDQIPVVQPALSPRTKSQRIVRTSAKRETKLTPAERYAYEQVKVALFITGSKLKIVQDTIDRVNDDGRNNDKFER